MKIRDIIVGDTYAVRVGSTVVPVQITAQVEIAARGTRYAFPKYMIKFAGVNRNTGRKVGPYAPTRIRYHLDFNQDTGRWESFAIASA